MKLTEAGVLCCHVFGREKLLRDRRFADIRPSKHQDAVDILIVIGDHIDTVVHASSAP